MTKKILIIALLVIILVTAWYFLIYKPSQNVMVEGQPCTLPGGLKGTIVGGVCKIEVIESGLPVKK